MKKDCFAYRETKKGPRCMSLEELYCAKGKCRFYKKEGTQCNTCENKEDGLCTKCRMIRQSEV